MSLPARLSCQEVLRTLGTVLDMHGSTLAVIHVTATGARVLADVASVREEWSLEALAAESARQQQQRAAGHTAVATPWARRLGWQLRLVGAALDLAGPLPFTIMARPEEVYVFNTHGYRRAFRHTALERRAALAAEFRGQPTTCPICGEPESLVALFHDLPDDALLAGARPGDALARPTHRCRLCGSAVRLAARESE
jgi:hypothetical protein